MITDANGVIVWQWDNTDPFGNNIPNQSPNGTGTQFVFNLRFAGQYFDQETGTYYNGFRDYDPATGRYLESDPIGLYGGQDSTYAYVNGNPLTYVDNFGLDRKWYPLGEGYTAGVDQFTSNGVTSAEVHVYDPKGNEVGMYGPNGWFNKHGLRGRPDGIPESVENQCRGKMVDFGRRAGYVPPKGTADIKGRNVGEFMEPTSPKVVTPVLGIAGIVDFWFQFNDAMKADAAAKAANGNPTCDSSGKCTSSM
jgi:RHS repeat-associated protein